MFFSGKISTVSEGDIPALARRASIRISARSILYGCPMFTGGMGSYKQQYSISISIIYS